jgi:beta-glucosidase
MTGQSRAASEGQGEASQMLGAFTAPLVFPDGFLWGVATAAHQVEGDNRHNDWWRWEQQPGRIADGGRSGAAAEWWAGRAEHDLRLAAELGINAQRLSLEWSRLELVPGRYDDAAFARYRQILQTMGNLGMVRSVTLYHFTLPQWAAERGSWLNPALPGLFARFAAECVHRLGDRVEWWATMNEPMILIHMAYLGKRWPPGLGSARAGRTALANLLRAHHAAYLAAKRVKPDAQVGIVFNLPIFDPATTRVWNRAAASLQGWALNNLQLHALWRGKLEAPLAFPAERLPAGPNAADWIGLNYYGRYRVCFDVTCPDTLFGRHVQESVHSKGIDWGEIYPYGLTRQLQLLAGQGKPLFVTENGIFDAADERRPAYLLRHLRAVHAAIRLGVDVRGYFHWTLVDNFEWAEGWTTPFGLIAVDPATQTRTLRHSAQVYAEVIRANAIAPALWQCEVLRQNPDSG